MVSLNGGKTGVATALKVYLSKLSDWQVGPTGTRRQPKGFETPFWILSLKSKTPILNSFGVYSFIFYFKKSSLYSLGDDNKTRA